MQILVVHDSDGVYEAFTGTLAEINDSIRGSKYWEEIVKRLDYLLEEEIEVQDMVNNLHHDGDSERDFTLLNSVDPPSAKIMTHEEKVKYYQDALNLCGFGVTETMTDLMVRIYDLILENKGDTNLRQVIHVKQEHKKAFPEPKSVEDESPADKKEIVEESSSS